MIYRCISPRLQGLDILKISKGVLQPEMNSWLIRERFWHSSLNVGWTHFPLIRDKNLDQGNFDELWSSFYIGANFQCLLNLEKTLQFGELSNHQHMLYFLIFIFLPRISFKILFLLAMQKWRLYFKILYQLCFKNLLKQETSFNLVCSKVLLR